MQSQMLDPGQLEKLPWPSGISCCDSLEWASRLPPQAADLLILDPPYNLSRAFGGKSFRKLPVQQYTSWLDQVVAAFLPVLKPTATVYICGDWLTSHSIYEVASRYLVVRNRITWERDKGRGSKTNWKSNCEDIWFCTVGKDYCFNADDVRTRRPVIAPYRHADGQPKDWQHRGNEKYRDTHPSNLWTDISIPFWSMPENTEHPTQKSEKLMARLILASTVRGQMVLDPFAGSGSSCVAAAKLDRPFVGLEADREYVLLGLRRLELASQYPGIQGYRDGVFWPRNSRGPHTSAK